MSLPNIRISAENLSFEFEKKPVFAGLTLELGGKNPVVLLGPSGCGKTTLLRLMAGLLKPAAGRIRFESVPDPENPGAEEWKGGVFPAGRDPEISFVFQEPRLFPWYGVLENVTLPIQKLLGKEAAGARARRFLNLVSLDGGEAAYPGELSGGQRQRVALARAFAYPAPVLFMDEPFQSLDIPLRIRMMDLTLGLLREEPRLVVAVTHDPREAVYMGRRIILLGPRGIAFDEELNLSREERAYGSRAQGLMEARLLRVLSGV
ncbi:MAG: ABC transporter ATP-binding protein [Spirochaetaceae bacterium]|nr:ABC transporter ATP-binding protein [Spirochaetaceae bacterium]